MRTKHRNTTDQMLFLIKSDFIEHLFFYFCFFYRSLQLLFKPNQTPKKKNSKSQKTNYKKYILLLILVLHSLQPITKKFIHINIVVGDCGSLRVQYVLVMGSPISRAPVWRLRSTLREIAPSITISPSRDRTGAGEIWFFFLDLWLVFFGFGLVWIKVGEIYKKNKNKKTNAQWYHF